MAKDKIDLNKLQLGTKKRQVRKPPQVPVDQVVEQIHTSSNENQAPLKETKKVPTKRITLDIPIPMHATIRKHTFDLGISMKQYFLELALNDIENEQKSS